jgi:integrase
MKKPKSQSKVLRPPSKSGKSRVQSDCPHFAVKSKGRIYRYAWVGGPRLDGEPGSAEFAMSWALAQSAPPTRAENISDLIEAYERSPEFENLAVTTRKQWVRWFDPIRAEFGSMPLSLTKTMGFKRKVLEWRDNWSATPRTADYAVQVLQRVLNFGRARGWIDAPQFVWPKLYSSSRADKVWTEDQIAKVRAVAPITISRILDFAIATGWRRGDILSVTWADIDAGLILTSKSNRRAVAVLVESTQVQKLLASIPRTSAYVFLNASGTPYTPDGFEAMWRKSVIKAGLAEAGLTFHDLRGTFVTRCILAGLPSNDVAALVGWDAAKVERIAKRYVTNRSRATAAGAALDAFEKNTS